MDYHVQLELRGIPAQAWHLPTAEHILGSSCWIERLHPGTRSRSDLATFRLDGRARDPKEIKPEAVLVIVEQLPASSVNAKPITRTLTYPITIKLISAVIDDDALVAGAPPPDHGDGGGHGGNRDGPGQRAGRQRPHKRGRKRRRADDAPDGHADGMALDSCGWRQVRSGRADGVSCDAGWPGHGGGVPPAGAAIGLSLSLLSEVPASASEPLSPACRTPKDDALSGQTGASRSALPGVEAAEQLEHATSSGAPTPSARLEAATRLTQSLPPTTEAAQDNNFGQEPLAQACPLAQTQGPVAHAECAGNVDDSAAISTVQANVVLGAVATPAHAGVTPSKFTSPRKFATPPIVLRRRQLPRPAATPWTLGDFLKAVTCHLRPILPSPGKRARKQNLNFSPRRGCSSSVKKRPTAAAPPTAERRAQVQILRTLGVIDINETISPEVMSAYDRVFSAPIPLDILSAIAAIVDRELPIDPEAPPCTVLPAGCLIEV
uniref:Uncharacterized protein n=1 Tax=Avena sativa TaxID=4498 RepID=A0ACD5W4Z0_AVESA